MRAYTLRADLLLLLTAFIWGTAFVAQRTGMEHVGPYTYNGIRFALGALVLYPVIRSMDRVRRSKVLKPEPSFGKYVLSGIVAGSVLFGGAALQQVGIVYTTAGKAGFITGLYVVIVPLMGLAVKQRVGAGTWTGAVMAAAGMYLLSISEGFSIEYGDLLVFVGAFFWAAHVHVIGRLSPRMNPVKLASMQFMMCSLLSLGTAVAVEEITLSGIRDGAWAILYGGLLSVGIAYTLQVVAQREAPPAHSAIILSLETVFAALAGWVVLGELLGPKELLGCGLMLAGMLLSQLRP